MQFPRTIRSLLIAVVLLGAGPVISWSATVLMSADVLSLTLTAQSLPSLNLPELSLGSGLVPMPFYIRVNYSGVENLNWGLELYSNNQRVLGSVSTQDGLLRGLRGSTNVAENIPLYWQVYNDDQNVAQSWGTPASVTSTAGGLGFYPNTLHYWSLVYDRADVDRVSSWDVNRSERLVVSGEALGVSPQSGRNQVSSPVFIYFGGDLRQLTAGQEFRGNLTLQLFNYPQDFNRGCFATPNPVKPVLDERVYFNFYTNYPNSKIVIKIFDPTGFPVRTIKDDRYWDCRNDRGHLVEGGLYLYQIEVEGHVISGTVVVIK
jgi:hypothetical protein